MKSCHTLEPKSGLAADGLNILVVARSLSAIAEAQAVIHQ
jgi:hypothetical protein